MKEFTFEKVKSWWLIYFYFHFSISSNFFSDFDLKSKKNFPNIFLHIEVASCVLRTLLNNNIVKIFCNSPFGYIFHVVELSPEEEPPHSVAYPLKVTAVETING